MTGKREERHMEQVMEKESFKVLPISPSREKTPDYIVYDNKDKYYVEVKGKQPASETIALEQSLVETGLGTASLIVCRTNPLSKTISEAARQLEALTNETGSFRVIWLSFLETDHQVQSERAVCTLYGIRRLQVVLNPKNLDTFQWIQSALCFYYDFSDFYRYPHVDGAIIATQDRGLLCVNEFSDNAPKFRCSRLFSIFKTSIIDPLDLKSNNQLLFVDSDIDRRDEGKVLEHLRNKHKPYYFSPMIESAFLGRIEIDLNKQGNEAG